MELSGFAFIVIDIIVVLVYVIFVSFAYNRGFLYGLVSIIFSLCSIVAAWFLSPVLASSFPIIEIDKMYETIEVGPVINTLLYFVILFLAIKLIGIIILALVKNFKKIPVIGGFDRFLGVVLGFINGTIVSMFLAMLLSLPLFSNGSEVKEKTFLKYIDKLSTSVLNFANDHLNFDYFKNKIEGFDVDNARLIVKEWLDNQAGKISNE